MRSTMKAHYNKEPFYSSALTTIKLVIITIFITSISSPLLWVSATTTTSPPSTTVFNPHAGIDLWNFKWNHDHIRLNIICSSDLDPNSCQQYQRSVVDSYNSMAQRLRTASGNQNIWQFDYNLLPQNLEEDNHPGDSITIKPDGSPSGKSCLPDR